MSDTASGIRPPAVGSAAAAADRAAANCGVHVRELGTLSETEQLEKVYQKIWQSSSAQPFGAGLLRALAHAGAYVVGAFSDTELVGGCVGFCHAPPELTLHSHITGVVPAARGRNVGFALKTHQRAWALQHGIDKVTWTFDPLVRRNAHFNIAKLAASPTAYLVNFYGTLDDRINGPDDSDRLFVEWRLNSDQVSAACRGQVDDIDEKALLGRGAVVGLAVDDAGRPVDGNLDGSTVLVAIPADIEQLRATNLPAAASWRAAVREVLGELLAAGRHITGFAGRGWYVVTKEAG